MLITDLKNEDISRILFIFLYNKIITMKNLNRFAFLFCTLSSLSLISQMGVGGFNLDVEVEKVSNPLPQILLSFDAIFDNTKVELTWSSNTENNNNFFSIEKSKDAQVFEEVTSIKGFGNNSSIISYYDVDYTPFEGISYYRLKLTDLKGVVLSSRIVSINNKNVTSNLSMNQSAVYETPANLMGSENKEVLVVLRNEKGMESYSKVIIDHENNVIMPTESENKLEIGNYIVIASSDNKLYSQKIVVK